MLDGQSRIGLTVEQERRDLQQGPTNKLPDSFPDNEKRTEVRRIVYEAFGQYLIIDPTRLGNFAFAFLIHRTPLSRRNVVFMKKQFSSMLSRSQSK